MLVPAPVWRTGGQGWILRVELSATPPVFWTEGQALPLTSAGATRCSILELPPMFLERHLIIDLSCGAGGLRVAAAL